MQVYAKARLKKVILLTPNKNMYLGLICLKFSYKIMGGILFSKIEKIATFLSYHSLSCISEKVAKPHESLFRLFFGSIDIELPETFHFVEDEFALKMYFLSNQLYLKLHATL